MKMPAPEEFITQLVGQALCTENNEQSYTHINNNNSNNNSNHHHHNPSPIIHQEKF